MRKIITWLVPPRKGDVVMVNNGIDAYCRANAISHRDSLRIQVCVEGVFAYLVQNIRNVKSWNEIHIDLFREDATVKVVMEHCGPGGEWDPALKADSSIKIRRTSFDSMGLFIAYDVLDSLTYDSWFDLGAGNCIRSYELRYALSNA